MVPIINIIATNLWTRNSRIAKFIERNQKKAKNYQHEAATWRNMWKNHKTSHIDDAKILEEKALRKADFHNKLASKADAFRKNCILPKLTKK